MLQLQALILAAGYLYHAIRRICSPEYYLMACLMLSPTLLRAEVLPAIAIIMDDIGYQAAQDRDAFALPGDIAYAVIPGTPSVAQAMKLAQQNQRELVLHMPMESEAHHRHSPHILTRQMNWIQFTRTIHKQLAAVPGVIAVNNHQGSALTQDRQRMQWLMQELSRHADLAFIDSRTTHKTVALDIARQTGLVAVRRDIFLDHEPEKIAQQFEALVRKAKQKGMALGIAHPYPSTLAFLKQRLQTLDQEGVQLIPLSQYLAVERRVASAGSNLK